MASNNTRKKEKSTLLKGKAVQCSMAKKKDDSTFHKFNV